MRLTYSFLKKKYSGKNELWEDLDLLIKIITYYTRKDVM